MGNVNLDLMYALPQQSMDQALQDIRTAIGYAPTHISAYHLTLEPNTAFHHAPPPLPDDDTSAAMQEAIEVELAQAGYQHYETSAFAQPGKQCRHNRNYWEFGDYLGIGAGAHPGFAHSSKLREPRLHFGKVHAASGYLDGLSAPADEAQFAPRAEDHLIRRHPAAGPFFAQAI